jgi:hypothetical protein
MARLDWRKVAGLVVSLSAVAGITSCSKAKPSPPVDAGPQVTFQQVSDDALQAMLNSLLFAWRWPTSGAQTLELTAPPSDAKEGGPFIHIQSYAVVP